MTACIVGWAHSPFGKLAGETVNRVSGVTRASRMALSAIYNVISLVVDAGYQG